MKRLLQLISLVFILIGTFLGVIYWKGDEYLIISITASLFFTIIFFFIIDMLIKNKENIRKRRLSSLSIFLWFTFLIVSFFSGILILHGLNVQFNAKSEIQKQTLYKLDLLENMTIEYTKIVNKDCSFYSNLLDDKLNEFILSGDENNKIYKELITDPYNFNRKQLAQINSNNISRKNKITKKYEKVKRKKFDKEIKDVDFKVKKFLKNNINTIKKWHILELNTSYYQLNTLLNENYKQLKNAFEKHKTNQNTEFDYKIPEESESIPLDNPLELWKLYNPNYLYGILAVFYLLLLSPYLIHGDKKRKYKGKTIDLEGGIEIK